MTTYFCDGLKEVTILNGVARLEFQRLEPVQRGSNRELRVVSEFIVALPVPGFVNALAALDKVRERLVNEGLLTPAGAGEGSTTAPKPEKSPNFS